MKPRAARPVRGPHGYEIRIFVSGSKAVQVHRSPASRRPATLACFALAAMKVQISVELDAARDDSADVLVVVLVGQRADLPKQPDDRVEPDPADAGCGPHWVAFDQAPDQGDALFVGETPYGRWYPVLSENANGAESSNPGDVLEIRGDQPTRHWLCDRHSRADLSCRPSVSSSWRARTPMRRRGGNN